MVSLTRRISRITEALNWGSSAANWSQSREIMGRERCYSLLSGDRRAEISRLAKERLGVENLKHRAFFSAAWRGFSIRRGRCRCLAGLPHLSEDQPAKGSGKRAKATTRRDAAAGRVAGDGE